LIFVFDPLAITLVIATNQAFKGNKKDEDNSTVNTPDYPVNTPQLPTNYPPTTPQVDEETDQTPTKHRPSTDQVVEIPTIPIHREPFNITEQKSWIRTNEEIGEEVNQNIKRLVYKKTNE
jgi:hypothetical protein